MQPEPGPTRQARQAALVRHIRELWYPRRAGAWLKAAPLDEVLDASLREALAAAGSEPQARLAVHRQIVQAFIAVYFRDNTSEDSRWGDFMDASWEPRVGEAPQRCIDAVLEGAAERIAEIEDEEAAARAAAEAGGYLHALGRPALADLMIDLPALREWFTRGLWEGVEPTWWAPAPDEDGPHTPAIIGVSDELVAILWLP